MNTYQSLEKKIMEDFDEKFPVKNDCTGKKDRHFTLCQGCIQVIIEDVDDIKSFLLTAMKEAYKLGEKDTLDWFNENSKTVPNTLAIEGSAEIWQLEKRFNRLSIEKIILKKLNCFKKSLIVELRKIVDKNKDDDLGTYDYDGIAKDILKFIDENER